MPGTRYNELITGMYCICVWIEQLNDLKQEFMKQEDQLRDVKKNRTNLERMLEYERYDNDFCSVFLMNVQFFSTETLNIIYNEQMNL